MRSPTQSLPAGTRVDSYTIRRKIGGGGFSIVYLAEEDQTRLPVVLKEYMPSRMATRTASGEVRPSSEEQARLFQSGRALFFQEASILATLKHANIVNVLNFFMANGTVYMAMTYEAGQNLQDYIRKRGRLSEAFLLTVFPPLLDGLRLIHEQGYLHLDIKPGNIHLRPGGNPLLLDFGAVHHRQESRQCQPGQVVTPGFSPIEQQQKTGYVGPWTDIYAIGATMRACLEGKPPPDAKDRHMQDELRPAAIVFRKHYPLELLEAIDWATEVDPLLRPQHVDELLRALPILEAAIPDVTPES